MRIFSYLIIFSFTILPINAESKYTVNQLGEIWGYLYSNTKILPIIKRKFPTLVNDVNRLQKHYDESLLIKPAFIGATKELKIHFPIEYQQMGIMKEQMNRKINLLEKSSSFDLNRAKSTLFEYESMFAGKIKPQYLPIMKSLAKTYYIRPK